MNPDKFNTRVSPITQAQLTDGTGASIKQTLDSYQPKKDRISVGKIIDSNAEVYDI